MTALTNFGNIDADAYYLDGAPVIPGAQNASSGRNLSNYGDIATELFNFDPTKMLHIRGAIARVIYGGGRATIACVGDSTTRGVGGGTGGTEYTNMKAYAWPLQFAKKLSGVGIPALCQGIFGTSKDTTNAALALEDVNLSLGSDWAPWVNIYGVGGGYFRQPASGTTALGYTPPLTWDTAKVLYLNSDACTATVKSGATTIGTLTETAAGNVGVATFNQTLGNGEFSLTWASGSSLYISGMWFYNSAMPGVDVLNLGWETATSGNWTAQVGSTAFTPLTGLAALAPDLTIINLGINDWYNSLSVSAFQANIQEVITAALASGDCVLVAPIPSSTTIASVAKQAQFINVLYELALANNIPLVDLTYRDVSYAVTSAWYWNAVHHNETGYADDAQAFLKLLLAL